MCPFKQQQQQPEKKKITIYVSDISLSPPPPSDPSIYRDIHHPVRKNGL